MDELEPNFDEDLSEELWRAMFSPGKDVTLGYPQYSMAISDYDQITDEEFESRKWATFGLPGCDWPRWGPAVKSDHRQALIHG